MSGSRLLTTEARGLGLLPELVREHRGAEALTRIFEAVKLPETIAETPHARVPLNKVVELFELAAETVQDPLFGYRVGQSMLPDQFGAWVSYSLAANDLRTALRRLSRSSAFYQGRHSIIAHCYGDTAIFAYASGMPQHFPQRHFSDHVILPILRVIRFYAGAGAAIRNVIVPYDDPLHHALLEQRLRLPVVHSPSMTGVAFDKPQLEAKVDRPGHELSKPSFAELRAMVRARPPRTIAEFVLATIHTQLLARRVGMEEAAAAIGLSTRTLQRRLMVDGYTFRELVDRARSDRATALLIDSTEPVSDIGIALGYEEKSHFTRAFRRWFNLTPTEFRRRNRTG